MRHLMTRRPSGRLAALASPWRPLPVAPAPPGAGEEQTLVDRATLTVQEILGEGNDG